MTTAQSPLRLLKGQADKIAQMIKAAERGEKIDVKFAEKIEAARATDGIKIAVVMDDKVISLELPWFTIRNSSEGGLAEYILDKMRETRDTRH